MVNIQSSVELRERCDDERSEDFAKFPNRDNEGYVEVVGLAKLGQDLGCDWRADDRR